MFAIEGEFADATVGEALLRKSGARGDVSSARLPMSYRGRLRWLHRMRCWHWLHRMRFWLQPLGDRAVGAVEFALLSPIIIGLILAVTELANVWHVQHALQSVASDTVRRVTTGALATGEAAAFVRKQLQEPVGSHVAVAVSEDAEDDADGQEVEVVLRVSLSEVLIFGSWLFSKTGADEATAQLSASATMIKQ